jgi:cytochrome c oxidase subunit 3
MSQAHEHQGGDDHGHDHGHGHGSRFIQHHYDDAQHQFDAGKLGIWFFLVQEVLFFSGLFVAYILYRSHRPEIFAYAHHYLDVKWGAINTGVLILSSLSAAWAVRCAQKNQQRGLVWCLVITLVCALGFLGIKFVEYRHKVHEGILFGNRFDPCISSGGAPLITRTKQCHGTKSGVVWEGGKAAAGCLKRAEVDQEPHLPGNQLSCTVAELKMAAGKEVARRELPACDLEGHGHDLHPRNAPCYLMQENPNVCPSGPAPLVLYGDDLLRGNEVKIEANCARPVDRPIDVLAHPETGWVVGAGQVATRPPPSAHDLAVEASLGAPPPNTNMFFSIYFAMTGLHGIHVLAGVFVFVWLLVRALKGHFTPDYFGPIDYAALYWHLVDLIWIFLFPMLYLIH